ncbi:MAG: efflux RND transporter periplasmic adaptor subunit [Gammaproteobacteria bacterium]|nr:efflux RND transporter periplasmic adaptor subunit [Gammaproteobacteria bacterium]
MRKNLLGLLIAAAVIGLPLSLKAMRQDEGKAVDVEIVVKRPIKASILASGNLVYREQAQLSPEVIGKVKAITVVEGQQVTAGQVVLRLDEEFYQAELASQEANVRQQEIHIERQELNAANQERQYRRSAELHKRRLLDDTKFDEARHALDLARVELRASREALEQARAQAKQSRERLAKTAIRSPIAGTVTAIDIKLGETAVASTTGIAGSSLATIANTDSLMVEANVDEADIARIGEGQEVAVYAVAYADRPMKGRVEHIPLSPKKPEGFQTQGASLARNYAVRIRLEPQEGTALRLRPGMTCRVEIFTSSADAALAVPIQAIFSDNTADTELGDQAGDKRKADAAESYVYVARNGEAEKRPVKTGLSDDSYQEIASGLKAGETVIVGPYKQLRLLRAGDKLKPTVAKPAEAGKPSEPRHG